MHPKRNPLHPPSQRSNLGFAEGLGPDSLGPRFLRQGCSDDTEQRNAVQPQSQHKVWFRRPRKRSSLTSFGSDQNELGEREGFKRKRGNRSHLHFPCFSGDSVSGSGSLWFWVEVCTRSSLSFRKKSESDMILLYFQRIHVLKIWWRR